MYFLASSGGDYGVWRSDGTESGTQLISQDEPGVLQFSAGLGWAGGRLIIRANFGLFGNEPATMDPVDGSIELLRDIAPGAVSSIPDVFLTVGELVYFMATDAEHGWEIWCTDGTPAGTRIAGEIIPGPVSALTPYNIAGNVGDALIVFPESGAIGREPWVIDGVSGTATFVADVYPGPESSWNAFAPPPVMLNDVALLILTVGDRLKQVWAIGADGQASPISAPIDTLTAVSSPVVVGDFAYLMVDSTLFRTDGTPSGLEPIDLDPGPIPRRPLFEINGLLVFAANAANQHFELWTLDPANGAVQRIATDLAGASPIASADGHVWFVGRTVAEGDELWRTDGTPEGTALVRDILPGAAGPAIQTVGAFDGRLLFSADDGTHGRELWVSDGTADGTHLVADLTQPGTPSSSPVYLFPLGDGVMFFASELTSGREPWFSDGTTDGTYLIRDVRPGSGSSLGGLPVFIGALPDGGVLAKFSDGTHGTEPWRTDGTPEGTLIVRDIESGGLGPFGFVPFEDGYAFMASSSSIDLWATDGTEGGTRRLIDIPPASGTYGGKRGILIRGNDALFSVTGAGAGHELFRGNISTGVMSIVADIAPGPASSEPRLLTEFNGDILFIASSPDAGDELRRLNPTTFAVSLLTDIHPGPAGSQITDLTPLGGRLVFAANDGGHGMELWSTDGTAGGTIMLADMWPGPEGSDPLIGCMLGNLCFFSATTPDAGCELWVTDGTPAGTRLVRDIFPGSPSSEPSGMVAFGGAVYFSARNAFAGDELWRSDGTGPGTVRVATIGPGPNSAVLSYMAVSGDQLFISAETATVGRELWVLRNESSPDLDGDGQVGLQDLAPLLAAFGSCAGDAGYIAVADQDDSGCVDLQDLAQVLASFGT